MLLKQLVNRVRELIRAGCGLEATGRSANRICDLCRRSAGNQFANPLQVAVAASVEFCFLDDSLLIDYEADRLRTGSLISVKFLYHIYLLLLQLQAVLEGFAYAL